MEKQRFYDYKNQIRILQERDKEKTLKVQTELYQMDDIEKQEEKEKRTKILDMKLYEVEMDKENNCVKVNLYDDVKEECTTITLNGEYFNREEYNCTSPNPTMVTSRGTENIFSGENADFWDGSDVFEIFYNNIMKFEIEINNY
tara:strand:+ start:262 stop:693 length:432 start_codon:yes stop_codon:yes gene_type:complete